MTPIEEAIVVYEKEYCARTFEHDLWLHLENGYVFSGPEFFIMGRPIQRWASYELISNPAIKFPNADCWLVWLAAGQGCLEKFFTLMPYPLPWIAWERKNHLRFWETAHLKQAL